MEQKILSGTNAGHPHGDQISAHHDTIGDAWRAAGALWDEVYNSDALKIAGTAIKQISGISAIEGIYDGAVDLKQRIHARQERLRAERAQQHQLCLKQGDRPNDEGLIANCSNYSP